MKRAASNSSSELFRAWVLTTVSWVTLVAALALTHSAPDLSLEKFVLLLATELCCLATAASVTVLYMLLCPQIVRYWPGPGGGEDIPKPKTLATCARV